MAAPAGTIWSNAYSTTRYYAFRLGMYVTTATTDTAMTVNTDVYFWSQYSIDDGSTNLFYRAAEGITTAYDDDMTYRVATPAVKSTDNTSAGWTASNQLKLYSASQTFARGTSAKTINIYSHIGGIYNYSTSAAPLSGFSGGLITVNTSVTVPALPTYTVSYNANGGAGAPAAQTKTYGTVLTLSTAVPTKEGHTFLGWGTSAETTTVAYEAGASYTANAGAVLYAVWEADTYTILYDANGGTGAPAAQFKTYGIPLTLSNQIPTRSGYRFAYWHDENSGCAFLPGDTCAGDMEMYLLAVWEPLGRVYLKQNGEYASGQVAVKDEGIWKTGALWVKSNGIWKIGG